MQYCDINGFTEVMGQIIQIFVNSNPSVLLYDVILLRAITRVGCGKYQYPRKEKATNYLISRFFTLTQVIAAFWRPHRVSLYCCSKYFLLFWLMWWPVTLWTPHRVLRRLRRLAVQKKNYKVFSIFLYTLLFVWICAFIYVQHLSWLKLIYVS